MKQLTFAVNGSFFAVAIVLLAGLAFVPTHSAEAVSATLTANKTHITQAGGPITFTAQSTGSGRVMHYIPEHSTPAGISGGICQLIPTSDVPSGLGWNCPIAGSLNVSWTVNVKPNLPCGTELRAIVDVNNQTWKSLIVKVQCPTSTPTPTATPTPTPITCSPDIQTKKVGEVANFSTNGTNKSEWTAQDGNPSSGTGKTFSTKYSQPGIYFVTVKDKGQYAECKVMVNANPTPTPTPTSTPTPTPTPTPSTTPTPTPEPEKDKGLRVNKTDNKEVTRPGHTLTYTIEVENTGDVDLHDVVVTDNVPSQLTVASVANGGKLNGSDITWNLTLGAGETKTVSFVAKVKDNTPNGHILHNVVTAESKDHDLKDRDTDDTRVERAPQVAAVVNVPAQPKPVPVTATTGAAGMTALASLLTGAVGLTYSIRKW